MKIGVLSDIHGNSVALKAVLDEVAQARIDELFVLGDFVGYYYNPHEVLAQLAPFTTTMVRGNHETMMEVSAHDDEAKKKVHATYGSGVLHALEKLESAQIKQLLELPETVKVTRDGLTFLLCHGSPWDNDEYIYPDASGDVLRRVASEDADFVLLGHTHHPFVHAHEGTVVLNPGSVGQPRDVGNLASWAIIDTSNRSVIHRRTAFDTAPVAEEARRTDPHVPYLVDVLNRKKI
jgi:putative phosphoesterase